MKLWTLPKQYKAMNTMHICATPPVPGAVEKSGLQWSSAGHVKYIRYVSEREAAARVLPISLDLSHLCGSLCNEGNLFVKLKGWDLSAGEVLAKYISQEIMNKTEGKFFEVIAYENDKGEVCLVGNE